MKKVQYLDLLRIYATFCVITLHCIMPFLSNILLFGTRTWWVCNILNSIARTGVPIFFMISGYLLLSSEKTLDFKSFYIKRLGKILLPFLVWDLIYYISNRLNDGKTVVSMDFFKELINNGSKYHLWFVYSLLGIYLFLPFFKRIIDKCDLKQCIWLLCLIIFPASIRPLLNTVTPIYIRLFDPLMECYIAFFLLGYILGKYEIAKKYRIIIFIGGVFGFLTTIFGIYLMSSHEALSFFFNGSYQIAHFMIATAVFVLFRYFREIKNAAFCKAITAYSGLTYGIYLIHVFIIENILYKYLKIFTPAVEVVVFTSLAIIISSLVMFLLSKIKYANRIFM